MYKFALTRSWGCHIKNYRQWECHTGHIVCIGMNAYRIISGSRYILLF